MMDVHKEPWLPEEPHVYSRPMQDKDINRNLTDIYRRLDRIENTQPGEPVIGSELDKRLLQIASDTSGIRADVKTLDERVANHIKFAWRAIGVLFVVGGTFALTLYNQHGTLSRIEAALPSIQMEENGTGVLNEEKIRKVADLVDQSLKTGTYISPQVLEKTGKKLLEVAGDANSSLAPSAWLTASELLRYRSTLNAVSTSSRFVGIPNEVSVSSLPPSLEIGAFTFNAVSTDPSVYPDDSRDKPYTFVLGPVVPLEQAAVSQRIVQPIKEAGTKGPAYIVFDSTIHFILDGFQLKHVVFRNGHIVYHGGSLILEDVYFVNCTFDIPRTQVGRELGNTLLASESINFRKIS
jgi:hypothetical protein